MYYLLLVLLALILIEYSLYSRYCRKAQQKNIFEGILNLFAERESSYTIKATTNNSGLLSYCVTTRQGFSTSEILFSDELSAQNYARSQLC